MHSTEISEFKAYCKELLARYEKEQIEHKAIYFIDNIISRSSENEKDFIMLLIEFLDLLLATYEFRNKPPEKTRKKVIDGIKSMKDLIESLDNNDKNSLVNLRIVLIRIIKLFFEKYEWEIERVHENCSFFFNSLWEQYFPLWNGIINDIYSSNLHSKLKKVAEFLEVLYIYVDKFTARWIHLAITTGDWGYDPFRDQFIASEQQGYNHKALRKTSAFRDSHFCEWMNYTYVFTFKYREKFSEIFETWKRISHFDKNNKATFEKRFEFIPLDETLLFNILKSIDKITERVRRCFPNYIILDGGKIFVKEEKLSLSWKDIDDETFSRIKGLEKQYNLRELDLSHNLLSCIPPMPSLKNLEILDVSKNRQYLRPRFDNIDEIKRLTNLRELNLEYNQIMDITNLKYLTKLERLNLKGNNVSNIEPLKTLSNLKEINLENNYIKNVESLQHCSKLEKVYLGENLITSINGFEKLKRLKELKLHFNLLEDVDVLKELPNLEKLYFKYNYLNYDSLPVDLKEKGLTGFGFNYIVLPSRLGVQQELGFKEKILYTLPKPIQEVLISLKRLTHDNFRVLDKIDENDRDSRLQLVLREGKIMSLRIYGDIKELPKNFYMLKDLEYLDCGFAKLNKIPESFKELTSLRSLNLAGNYITDLTPIKDLVNLEKLFLYSLGLNTIDQIKGLINLRVLDLNRNNLKEIPSFIRNFKCLEILRISGNPISVLPEWLFHMKSLKKVDIIDCKELIEYGKTKEKLQSLGIKYL